jgi:hypothetical protein
MIRFCSAGVLCIALTFTVCQETRTGIMLTRKAKKLRAETGDPRYRAKAEDERGSMKRLLWVSSTRPLSKSPVCNAFSTFSPIH